MNREATADLVVRAGTVHTMAAAERPVTALAVRRGEIVAVAAPENAQDLLETWSGPGTTVLDDPGLVVLPAIVDTHNHLMLAARNSLGAPVSLAQDIPRFLELIRERAAHTPSGQWIITGADWHELHLAERRMPTAEELDRATTDHPVLVLRGGHNGVLNSAGLRLAGIGPDTPDVQGGYIARDAAGRPTGRVQDAALELAQKALPALPAGALATGLAHASTEYAAHGIGSVRDPAVTPQEWHTYVRAQADGRLSVRSHAMILSTPASIFAAGSMGAYLDALEAQGITPDAGQGRLRLWGLKFILDGGVEAAALERPYADRPGYHGDLMWDRDDLAQCLAVCVRRGWPVGTHAFGDRAVAVLLDAIRDVVGQHGPIPPGALVIEHGGLIGGDQIADAVDLGVHITVQHALSDGLGPALLASFGPDRTAALWPLRELVDSGAWISAGTDHPIGPLDPLRCVHGMTTRHTPTGVRGPEHAIDRAEALRLYTSSGARLLGHAATGTLVPGAPADMVAYRADPFTCPADDLLRLAPEITAVGGEVVYRRA
ncbi:amidohydrolase [Nocardiopsis gilva YIM 90087]|uniref:Amidohydrolase n=1 Tax=Nocardiopsis gilva YIM 90087 TaxID=1235441 RepID=A0A223S3B1_9ACTN|nr:amidohydrolase [Nocardiopsis gilva]ASU82608.1 amidohydrolase [Nocardiopsis gilva YIM 90087]